MCLNIGVSLSLWAAIPMAVGWWPPRVMKPAASVCAQRWRPRAPGSYARRPSSCGLALPSIVRSPGRCRRFSSAIRRWLNPSRWMKPIWMSPGLPPGKSRPLALPRKYNAPSGKRPHSLPRRRLLQQIPGQTGLRTAQTPRALRHHARGRAGLRRTVAHRPLSRRR